MTLASGAFDQPIMIRKPNSVPACRRTSPQPRQGGQQQLKPRMILACQLYPKEHDSLPSAHYADERMRLQGCSMYDALLLLFSTKQWSSGSSPTEEVWSARVFRAQHLHSNKSAIVCNLYARARASHDHDCNRVVECC